MLWYKLDNNLILSNIQKLITRTAIELSPRTLNLKITPHASRVSRRNEMSRANMQSSEPSTWELSCRHYCSSVVQISLDLDHPGFETLSLKLEVATVDKAAPRTRMTTPPRQGPLPYSKSDETNPTNYHAPTQHCTLASGTRSFPPGKIT